MQAVVGRVDASDALVDPVTVPMAHTGTATTGGEVFSTTTPLPVAGPVGYTVRVLPHHPLLAAPTPSWGWSRWREWNSSRCPSTAGRTRWRPGPTARCG